MPNEGIKAYNLEIALQTAYDLFLTYGIENVTKEMISKECNLSRRSIDRYFLSKNDCVRQVMCWIIQKVHKDFPICEPFYSGTDDFYQQELLLIYLNQIKEAFLNEPRRFALYAEFKIYFYRNQEYFQKSEMMGKIQQESYLFRKKIRNSTSFSEEEGEGFGSTEEEYLFDSFFSFLATLAITDAGKSRAELERKIDHRIHNTLMLYSLSIAAESAS